MTQLSDRLKTNPDEAIQKTLAEDAKRRDEQRKAEATKFEYRFHPKADEYFPLMEGEEFEELVEDIKKNGLLEPIALQDKMILDGRNRYRACQAAGHKFSDKDFVETCVDPVSFVFSKNLKRRHLTAEQKREAITKLLKSYPEASSRALAAKIGVSHNTVEAVRTATGQIDQLENEPPTEQPTSAPATRTGRDGKKRRTSTTKKRGPSPKQQADKIANFKGKWETLDDWQKHSFVKAYKDELAELIQDVEAEEAEAQAPQPVEVEEAA